MSATELFMKYYPYAVMTLSFVAALGSVVGGLFVGISVALAPVANPPASGDCSCNYFGGFATFVGGCLVAMACLYVGGKFVGAF